MIKSVLPGFILILSSCFACYNPDPVQFLYPSQESHLDREVDDLLTDAEERLFSNNFEKALDNVERAERLLPFVWDRKGHRRLRLMFDKAIIITCLEGPSENSAVQFREFDTFLASRSCHGSSTKDQPNLFDDQGHWPILGNGPINVEDCLERVNNTEKALEIACAALQVSIPARMAIEAAIYSLSRQAKLCCVQDGFWKTCVQPIVDAWKKSEIFGIPPDPYLD